VGPDFFKSCNLIIFCFLVFLIETFFFSKLSTSYYRKNWGRARRNTGNEIRCFSQPYFLLLWFYSSKTVHQIHQDPEPLNYPLAVADFFKLFVYASAFIFSSKVDAFISSLCFADYRHYFSLMKTETAVSKRQRIFPHFLLQARRQ